MALNSNDIQTESSKQRGGRRAGAGRKRLDFDARYFEARGIEPLYAAEILARVIDERATWKRILESPDDRIVLDGLKFLMAMRDGKPAQSVNLTSTNINISSSDVNKARAIVQEIRQSFAHEQTATIESDVTIPRLGADSGEQASSDVRVTTQAVENAGLMLLGDEGGGKDG